MTAARRSRRAILRDAVAMVVAIGAVPLLAACGGSTTTAGGVLTGSTGSAAPATSGSSGAAASASASTSGASSASFPNTSSNVAATSSVSGKPGGTLRIGQVGDPRTFNPARQMEYWNWGGLYDSVLRFDEHLSPVSHLATKYAISTDGKQITLTLRQDVKFASGRAFTSADVAYMINLIQQPKAGALYQSFAQEVARVDTTDPHTATLTLSQPEAGMLDLLANLYIVDKDNAQNLDAKGVGTGPFQFVEFVPDDHVTFKRNPSYWQTGRPYLDQLHVTLGSDPQAILAQLQAGALDMTTVAPTDLVRLQKDSKYQTITVPNGMANIWLKTTEKPFTDKRVRQAINYAIDRARYARVVLQNLSQPTDQPFPPFHWAYFPDLENAFPFDLNKAKSLLAEAGYASGFDTTILASSTSPDNLGLAQIIQQDLKTIGVNVKIDARDSVSWAQAADAGQFHMLSHSYGRFNSDPSLLFKGTVAWRPINNPTGFADPQYGNLINAQSQVIDRAARKPLVKQLIQYVQDQSFVIPVAPTVTGWVYAPKVKGFYPIAGQVAYMDQVSLG